MNRSLVILTFNEIEGIRVLFDKIPFDKVGEYLVIDGGSTDGTKEFFQERGIKVIIQKIRGRGEAFRLGIFNAKYENVVFFSPDGNEDPNDIPKLFEKLENGSDMVIASRFLKGARNEEDDSLLPLRAWVNRFFGLIANLIWNRKRYITDTINGYRGVSKDAFNRMKVDAPGFVIEYQMSIRAMELGLRVSEIPTYEGNRIGGKSTAKSLPCGLLFLRFLFREIFVGKKFS